MNPKVIKITTLAFSLLITLIACSGKTTKTIDEEITPTSSIVLPTTTQPLVDKTQLAMAVDTINTKKLYALPMMKHKMINHIQPPSIRPIKPVFQSIENYQNIAQNSIKQVSKSPLSTFSVDVDTGSYANVRRFINQGKLPPSEAVRVEEMLNYFNYQQSIPQKNNQPFSVNTEIMTAPWNNDRRLLKIGLKGYEIPKNQLTHANLVFLLDVSGSMNSPHKLPLLKRSLTLLTNQLDSDDRVSIVVYAGAAGVVLPPTAGNNHTAINNALHQLNAGGSTNGGQGIKLAYQLAQQEFVHGGINRVILATDGDFNVGVSNINDLKKLIESQRKKGITLTTLGFGQGNYNDYLMEQIADIGNGNYAYIDNINEARKVLVDQLSSTLTTIAHDVKIQIEFNPAMVSEYRLIGYENRALANEDFNNDKVDAGDIGAGHQVTALYELTMTNAKQQSVDSLRYQAQNKSALSNELAHVKLRYKLPNHSKSKLISHPISTDLLNKKSSTSFNFAAAVSAFAQALKGGKYLNDYSIKDMIILAQANKGSDNFGYRSEFIQLLRTVDTLTLGPLKNHKILTKDLSSNIQIIN